MRRRSSSCRPQLHYRHGYCARTHRRPGDVGPGERPARGAERTGPADRVTVDGRPRAAARPAVAGRPRHRVVGMCRNITTLRGLEPVATPEEIEAAARQYVRKVSGVQSTSPQTEEAFERAVTQVTKATTDAAGRRCRRASSPRRPCRRCAGSPPRRPPPRPDECLDSYMPFEEYIPV